MQLRGIEFGRVLGASGVQGFFGEGYWYHKPLRPIGLDFSGMTFVAKTTTLRACEGHMKLRADFTPKKWFPDCIVVKFRKGVALNAIGLSGPGAHALFSTGKWQARREPFFISFMSVAKTPEERREELSEFILTLLNLKRWFRAPMGLQINYSCPNVGIHPDVLVKEVSEGLTLASRLGIPLMPKFNVLLPVGVARDISRHPACDGICISNTIPWGERDDQIHWKKLFGSDKSPLEKYEYGKGGLSGKLLLPFLLEWLEQAKLAGITKPINAGGGILSLADAKEVFARGADSIFLGSIAFLRPWRVRGIIRALQ